MKIPVTDLQQLARQHGLSIAILYAWQPEGDHAGQHHIVTYGENLDECSQAADFGNDLKDALGWPDRLQDQPPRVKDIHEALKWLVHLHNDVGKAGGRPKGSEWEQAIKSGMEALKRADMKYVEPDYTLETPE